MMCCVVLGLRPLVSAPVGRPCKRGSDATDGQWIPQISHPYQLPQEFFGPQDAKRGIMQNAGTGTGTGGVTRQPACNEEVSAGMQPRSEPSMYMASARLEPWTVEAQLMNSTFKMQLTMRSLSPLCTHALTQVSQESLKQP